MYKYLRLFLLTLPKNPLRLNRQPDPQPPCPLFDPTQKQLPPKPPPARERLAKDTQTDEGFAVCGVVVEVREEFALCDLNVPDV